MTHIQVKEKGGKTYKKTNSPRQPAAAPHAEESKIKTPP